MKVKMIIEIIIFVLLLPFAFTGLSAARQIDYTQTVPAVVTAAGSTANATLAKPLFEDDIVNVSGVTSSNLTDTPVATVYNTGTKVLTVDGLVDNTTRTLYIAYGYPRFDSGFDTLFAYLPLALMGLLAWDVVRGFMKGR